MAAGEPLLAGVHLSDTTYVASYYAPNGRYSTSDGYFTTPTTNGPSPLCRTARMEPTASINTALLASTVGYAASNYWVDVVYTNNSTDTTKPTLTDKDPASGATRVAASTDVTATFSESVTPSSITMALRDSNDAPVNGSTAYDSATRRATFNPRRR